MFIALLGAPGSGKGTQAKRLSTYFNIPSISTGDLIRDEVSNETPLGKTLAPILERGDLVPDEIIIELFNTIMTYPQYAKGFIADGYPRTRRQAIALDEAVSALSERPLTVLHFDISLEILLDRMLGRLICQHCKSVYHRTTMRPKIEGRCDNCNSVLTTRKDDTEEIIERRNEVFLNTMNPILEFYGQRIVKVDATLDPEIVFETLIKKI